MKNQPKKMKPQNKILLFTKVGRLFLVFDSDEARLSVCS